MMGYLRILAFLAIVNPSADAFVPRSSRPSTYRAILSSTANAETRAEKTSMTTLDLIGEVTQTSEAAPFPKNNGKNLKDFFHLPDSAALILRGSKNNHIVEITDPDASLVKAYHQQCQLVNAQPPQPGDKFYDVTTSGVDFPGLKVRDNTRMPIHNTRKQMHYNYFSLAGDDSCNNWR
jgi:hypothetical protein